MLFLCFFLFVLVWEFKSLECLCFLLGCWYFFRYFIATLEYQKLSILQKFILYVEGIDQAVVILSEQQTNRFIAMDDVRSLKFQDYIETHTSSKFY